MSHLFVHLPAFLSVPSVVNDLSDAPQRLQGKHPVSPRARYFESQRHPVKDSVSLKALLTTEHTEDTENPFKTGKAKPSRLLLF